MTFINYFKGYCLIYSDAARREIKKIKKYNKRDAQIIDNKLQLLIEGRKGLDIKKIVSCDQRYRLRVGDYRVLFEVRKSEVVVIVVGVRLRKEAY